MNPCHRILRRVYLRDCTGSAALEFAIVAPVLFLFLFGVIETGVIFFAGSMLQNATNDTARRLRTGQMSGTLTASQIRTSVCSEVNGLISDCNTALQVDLRNYANFSSANYPTVTQANGTVNTNALQIDPTSDCSIFLMRTFYAWNIMTPLMAPLLQSTSTGQILLTSSAAFRTEPYAGGSTC